MVLRIGLDVLRLYPISCRNSMHNQLLHYLAGCKIILFYQRSNKEKFG